MNDELDYEKALMIKTAWYYYIENYTQQKISDLLGISRIRVIKLLERARQTEIIQFKLHQDNKLRMETEAQLISRFGLNDVFVVPSTVEGNTNENVARAAAMYISNRLDDKSVINMGYGDTLSRVLNHLATTSESPLSVVSLTGGVNHYLPNTTSSIFNAKLYLMPTPLIVQSPEIVDAMLLEPVVKEIKHLIPLSSMTVVGIGAISDDATILNSGILRKNDFMQLKMKDSVGDILCHFIDSNGNLVENEVEHRLLSTSLDTLRTLHNVIGVAAGDSKVPAILAALRGKYLNTLVTDEDTANKLLALV